MADSPQIPPALESAFRPVFAAFLACLIVAALGMIARADTAQGHPIRRGLGAVNRAHYGHDQAHRLLTSKMARRAHAHRRRLHRRAGGARGLRRHITTLGRRPVSRSRRAVVPASLAPLVFGIYPGGSAGAVGPTGSTHPEDQTKRLGSLEQLRPAGKPFVLRLYASYGGPSAPSAAAQVAQDIAEYTTHGFQVELVLCYRPRSGDAGVAVPGFVTFVRNAVEQLGSNQGVVSLQVTNEANVSGAPNAADGYYVGAKDALIAGIEGAAGEIRRDGFYQLRVGFSWAYQVGPAESAFWSYLGNHGGSTFRRALDWVGIDAYPGTWGPTPTISPDVASGVRQATVDALHLLRNTYMPLAAFARTVPIHVSESGYPTGPGRSAEKQSATLQAAVHAVSDFRTTYNVSDFRWFDLRDANSSSASFEDQYGLMTDGYVAKPAFVLYHLLISTL